MGVTSEVCWEGGGRGARWSEPQIKVRWIGERTVQGRLADDINRKSILQKYSGNVRCALSLSTEYPLFGPSGRYVKFTYPLVRVSLD